MPVLVWVIAAILVFNVLFVALRLWATRPRELKIHRARGVAPAFATIIAKEYPRQATRRVHTRSHAARH